MSSPHDELVYDWNQVGQPKPLPTVELFDETLRDGLQSPSVNDPPLDKKLALVRLMDKLGITALDVGLPGAGQRASQDSLEIIKMIASEKLKIRPGAAARTMIRDIEPIADIAQKTGMPVEIYAFIGSSPIRFFAESWSIEKVCAHIKESVRFASAQGLETCLVTEDTTRSSPEVLRPMLTEALDSGAWALCLCDTVGHSTPDGVRALVRFAQDLVADYRKAHPGHRPVRLDWHGHNDRGLAVINALTAAAAGVERIHGSALGIGERVGNAAIDQIIVNLKLLGAYPHDVQALHAFCALAAEATGMDIAINHPAMGRDAFRTATGVHAAAIIKALKKGDKWLADRVYSAVPASELGREQEIEVGHMSGTSNVVHWLEAHAVPVDEALVNKIFAHAKATHRTLTDDEIWSVVRGTAPKGTASGGRP